MPTPTSYSYALTAFPKGRVNPTTLESEVRASAIVVALDRVETSDAGATVWFRDALSAGDVGVLDAVIAAHDGTPDAPTGGAPVPVVVDMPTTPTGLLRTVNEKPDWTRTTVISHDFCDPTTWYSAAARVVGEAATPTATPGVYQLAHPNVVDVRHGKISQEDYLLDAAGNGYQVVVTVDGASAVEQDPHTGVGDYAVDYAAGRITFASPPAAGAAVAVTYHHATTSAFCVRPAPGKQLKLEVAEIQFAADIILTDTAVFQPYGWVEAFAPQLCTTNGGTLPPGTKIPLGQPVRYKSMRDYLNDAIRAYPRYPPLGGPSWRGLGFETVVMDWDYVSATILDASKGMEIKIYLEHDAAFQGAYATVSFYCVSLPLP